MQPQYPAKVILFGEYSIITGSEALLVPLETLNGSLIKGHGHSADPRWEKFIEYLGSDPEDFFSEILDLDRFRGDIKQGLRFDSTIPVGSGLGSSAALVSAVFTEYSITREEFNMEDSDGLKKLRQIFIRMESFFHGQSSGIDPVCSFTGEAVHITADKLATVGLPSGNGNFYLVDSGITAETGPLVKQFRKKIESDIQYSRSIETELIPLVNSCIASCLAGSSGIKSQMISLSEMQLDLFKEMIPGKFRQIWLRLLKNQELIPKLCGSGGGGFFLIYSEDREALKILQSEPGTGDVIQVRNSLH